MLRTVLKIVYISILALFLLMMGIFALHLNKALRCQAYAKANNVDAKYSMVSLHCLRKNPDGTVTIAENLDEYNNRD